MKVTLGGEAVTLVGNDLKVGDKAPDFSLNNLNNEPVQLANLLTQPVLLNVVPDIETGVCQLQTKRFNQEANKITEAKLVTISKNSREEQQNWCAVKASIWKCYMILSYSLDVNTAFLLKNWVFLLARFSLLIQMEKLRTCKLFPKSNKNQIMTKR